MKKKFNEKEIAKNYLQLLKEKEEAEKQIVSNYDYISWLETFTQAHPSFASDSWLYKSKELSTEDYDNVEKIFLFFNGISDYCHRYYINVECDENFEHETIHIKHNNVGYQLGLVIGQGSFVYVYREEPLNIALEFSDIMSDIIPEDFKEKEELLEKLEKLLSEMKNKDIPSETVINTVKKYYNH